MIRLLLLLFRVLLLGGFRSRRGLVLENLALRQQLAVLKRRMPRPRFVDADRRFWVALSRFWDGWRSGLHLVKPETVVDWHKRRFRKYWRWKSRPRGGRPRVPQEIRDLIRRMARMSPLWGAPRIHGELLKLGIQIAQSTVSKYLPRRQSPRPGSQSWMTFLRNHAEAIVAVDFFVVPTVTFRLLYGIVVIAHDRRRLLQVNVTQFPTARWAAQQIVEAFAFAQPTRFLLRGRDGIYGKAFRRRIASLGMEELLSAPRSPWQNPSAERVIGTVVSCDRSKRVRRRCPQEPPPSPQEGWRRRGTARSAPW